MLFRSPFAALAALARFLDGPERWFDAWPSFRKLGVAGVAALWAALAAGSALAILALRSLLFDSGSAAEAGVGRSSGARAYAHPHRLPQFDSDSGQEPEPDTDPGTRHEDPFGLDGVPDDREELREYYANAPAFSSEDLPPPPELKTLRAEEAAAPVLPAAPEDDADTEKATVPGTEDQPIPMMFGRDGGEGYDLPETDSVDPASSGDFWAEDGADEAEAIDEAEALEERAIPVEAAQARAGEFQSQAQAQRKPLLPVIEVFQDGEHAESVRSSESSGSPLPPRGARTNLPKASGRASAAPSVQAAGAAAGAAADAPPADSAASVRAPARPKPALKPYSIPTDGILLSYPDGQYWIIDEKTRHAADVLRETLKEFNIEAEVTGIRKGPVITMFEILPAPGVRLSKIANLADNIALRLAASSVRIVAPIPGKHAVGIEVPNERRSIVSFREIVENPSFKDAKMEVPVVLGKDISGEVQVAELTQTPHLLIAGATGSGKSVCVNSIILSILYRRSFNEVKLILIDPKIVELKLYNGIPHLLTPVITEPKRAFQALQYCICEMERRYSLLDAMGVRDIRSYNRKISEKEMATDKLPYIVVVIDEFADLMATTGKELESTLARLAAMSRAVGIHLVLATQRPSIDVITGLIKANIPSRIAFMVASKFDSRIIIDMVGAEKLLGRGDMLYAGATDAFPMRMQGAFVSDDEVERVVAHVKTLGEPDYIDDEIFIDDEDEDEGPSLFDEDEDDPLFEKALEIVLSQGKASASFLQRKLKIGYNRAARIVELMEEKGIVGKAQGSKPRDLVRNPELGGVRPPSPRARYVPDPDPEPVDEDNSEDEDEETA